MIWVKILALALALSAVQIAVDEMFPGRTCRGRLLTRWLHRRVARRLKPADFRFFQILVGGTITASILGTWWAGGWFWLLLMADDVLTGDDDQWRRWREGVRAFRARLSLRPLDVRAARH